MPDDLFWGTVDLSHIRSEFPRSDLATSWPMGSIQELLHTDEGKIPLCREASIATRRTGGTPAHEHQLAYHPEILRTERLFGACRSH